MNKKNIPCNERLIFAIDVPNINEAKKLVDILDDSVSFYKIGLELFMTGKYFDLVDWLLNKNKKVFADLKFFDVPETVKRAVHQLKDSGVSFTTVHGNDGILSAAVSEKGNHLKILAVTVLTSLDQGDILDLGFQCNVEELVLSRTKRALKLGCDGVVSSGLEAEKLRGHFGNSFLVVTPGIRPVENKTIDDQKRIVTVEQAFNKGADYIVIGRPIKLAPNPRDKALEIQKTISTLFDNTK